MSYYDSYSKEELIRVVKQQEQSLKSKKYGLVWDDEKEPEQVVLDCANHLPILKRVKSKEIKEPENNTQEDNILIEGDNYHALSVLNYTHKEKIDVIYIDPPYNTGNKDFKYNDSFVDREDGYRHSKWLNFMEKRLKLARELLKEEGVIFISIDDIELYQLKLLCDSIFGEENFIGNFIRKNKSGSGHDSTGLAIEYDYMLCYSKNKFLVNFNKNRVDVENDSKYNLSDDFVDQRGRYYLRDLDYKGSYSESLDYPITCPDNSIIWPGGKKGKPNTWRWSENKLKWGLEKENNFIVFKKNKEDNWKVYIKQYQYVDNEGNKRIREIPYRGLINYSNSQGSKELKEILTQEIFNYPKPIDLIKFIINLIPKKELIILDFFAGTGTTGHAVLDLNKKLNFKKKFIICTNNENNICEKVTYPRIKNVIKGYSNYEGLGGNLQYFKTSLIKYTKNRDQTKINLTHKCAEMICLKENIFNIEAEEEDYKIYSSNSKDSFVCIYFNFIDDSFHDFLNHIKQLKGRKKIYLFSLEDRADTSLFQEVDNFSLEAIPKQILEIYKRLIKMNIPVKPETIFIDLEKAKELLFTQKDKDTSAKILRVVLEKLIQKTAQQYQVNILTEKGKEIKISTLNDTLKNENIISRLEWEENKLNLTLGNHASHGEYEEFDINQVNKFYKYVQTQIDKYNI